MTVEEIIDEISRIRRKNNENWFRLFRLVYAVISDEEKQEVPIISDMQAEENRRINNNKLIMNILKFGFKYCPQEAREIIKDISACDEEILKLSKQLGELK